MNRAALSYAAHYRVDPLHRGRLSVGMICAGLLLTSAAVFAQTSQGGSLADAARQARSQKQSDPQSRANAAQQVADELSEDQTDTGAPGGFKTYNAGDYQLWVPAPYKVEGHDDAGIVLDGPQVGVKHPIVLVGTPIAVHWKNDDAAFQETAAQFTHLYSQSSNCAKTTVAGHPAYQCGLAAANLLGQRISGNAVFVLGSGTVYPVFCASPSDSRSRDVINDPRASRSAKEWSRQSLGREDDDSRNVWQKCDTVFQSIHLKTDIAHQAGQMATGQTTTGQTAAGETKSGKDGAGPAASTGATASGPAPAGPSGPSSASAASGTQQDPPSAASSIPAGFRIHAFNYCKSINECWNASVLVPTDAKLVSSECKQFIFTTKVQGTEFLLMAGPAGGECKGGGPDPVRWNQLVDPENKRAPGTYSTISSQSTQLDGKPAIITTMSFRKGLDSWMGKRVEVENNGVPLVVGCIALRDHFADGDAMCSALIGSLQLP